MAFPAALALLPWALRAERAERAERADCDGILAGSECCAPEETGKAWIIGRVDGGNDVIIDLVGGLDFFFFSID